MTDEFIWGCAASSTQTEGAAPASDWARWERLGRAPASGEGNGFATRYAEDFALMASLGLTHHRLSLEWARLEPREGRHDPAAVEHYRRILTAARDAGIDVWVCLHHFTLPGWFGDDLGGFADDRARGYLWPRHVDWVAETFGDLVHGWKPVNEPLAYAAGGWLLGAMPPGTADLGRFLDAYRSILLANVDAARLLRGGGPVSTVMNLSPLFSRPGTDDPAAATAAREWTALVDEVMWGSWIGMLRDGVLRLPMRAEEEVPAAVDAFDLVGFSHYFAQSVDEQGIMGPWPPDAPAGPLGNTIWPEAMGLVLDRLGEELPDRPLVVAESGVGLPPGEPAGSARRAEYLRGVMDEVRRARRGGIDVRGVFWWTAVDNYEWLHGWDARFGLCGRDREPTEAAQLVAAWAGDADPR